MLKNLKQNKKILIIGVVIIIVIIIYVFNNAQLEKSNINDEILIQNNISNEKNEIQDENIIVVHITGAIKIPGVVRLTEGSRIEDAISKAGGLTEDANITNVNLAYVLEDGTKIKIPSILDDENNSQEGTLITDSGNGITENKNFEKSTTAININKANELELQKLQGIGPSLATKIVTYRTENGDFKNIEDIKNVSGIGESIFDNIKEMIYVK